MRRLGFCPVCGKLRALRSSGRVRKHSRRISIHIRRAQFIYGERVRCSGSGRRPVPGMRGDQLELAL